MSLRKFTVVAVVAALLWVDSGSALAGSIWQLTERVRVLEVVNSLFIETDNKNWKAVAQILAPKVHFDMTSLTGGKPTTTTNNQIVATWKKGLEAVNQVHHQLGNYLIRIDMSGRKAKVFCYGTATHYQPERKEHPITTFVGSYDLHLANTKGGWVIDGFKFNKKYVN